MHVHLKKLSLAAMLLALGILLPFVTGQIPAVGSMLLPMHLPVLLCGLVCGWQYGLAVGFILPILRSFLFSMPPMFPTAVSMAFELATYGFVLGLLYARSKWHCIVSLYRCLFISMLAGRAAWGVVQMLLLGVGEDGFTFMMFLSGAFLNAIPGILLQLILIPLIMVALRKTKLIPNDHAKKIHSK